MKTKVHLSQVMLACMVLTLITAMYSCEGDEFWGFENEYLNESINTRANTNSEFLDIHSTSPSGMTKKDWEIIGQALLRMTIINENDLSFVRDADGGKLNMSDRLFDFLKNGFDYGNKLLVDDKHVIFDKHKHVARRKTSAVEAFQHNCTGNDCVGHSISHYLHLDIESVNSTIHASLSSYPNYPVPCVNLESTLNLFQSFTKQSKFFPQNGPFPYAIAGIILIPGHALNGIYAYKYGGQCVIVCYDDQAKSSPIYYVPNNKCAKSPCEVTNDLFGYYK